jgi:hypothetical protein
VADRRPVDMTRWIPWLLRAVWVATAVVGTPAVTGAVEDRSAPVRAIALWGCGLGWIAGVAAMAIPSLLALTATRAIVPLATVVAVATTVGGAEGVDVIVLGALALVCTIVVLSGEIGRAFVQASAYGDEQRFPLRPPFGYAVATVVSWLLWAVALVSAPLLLAARSWVAGVVVTVLAVALTVFAVPRWHLLALRWLVLVPAGLVLHDPVVLGETLMLRASQVRGVRLAPAGTTAADLTGPATGHALEVSTTESVIALFARTPRQPNGRAIHLTAFLASPSRPGSALSAASTRLPVG